MDYDTFLDYGGNVGDSEIGKIEQPEVIIGDKDDIQHSITLSERDKQRAFRQGKSLERLSIEAFQYNKGSKDPYLRFQNHVYNPDGRTFYCDDHNHALAAWQMAKEEGYIDQDTLLLHVDDHPDMRNPSGSFQPPETAEEANRVIGDELKINEFIKPALDWEIISEVEQVRPDNFKQKSFEDYSESSFILDLDLDFFLGVENKDKHWKTKILRATGYLDNQSSYLDHSYGFVSDLWSEADFRTVAFSPHYISQDEAFGHLEAMLESSKE